MALDFLSLEAILLRPQTDGGADVISGAILIAPLATLFLVGVVLALRTRRFLRRAVRTRARVVGSERGMVGVDSTASASNYYTVEFTDQRNRRHRVALKESANASAENTLPILYDPRHPRKVCIDSPSTHYIVAAFCMAPAVLYALVLVVVKIMLMTGADAS